MQLQILTYARHSSAYGHWVVRINRATPTVTRGIRYNGKLQRTEWSCHYMYLLLRLMSVAAGFRSLMQPSACGANALTHNATATVAMLFSEIFIFIMVLCICLVLRLKTDGNSYNVFYDKLSIGSTKFIAYSDWSNLSEHNITLLFIDTFQCLILVDDLISATA